MSKAKDILNEAEYIGPLSGRQEVPDDAIPTHTFTKGKGIYNRLLRARILDQDDKNVTIQVIDRSGGLLGKSGYHGMVFNLPSDFKLDPISESVTSGSTAKDVLNEIDTGWEFSQFREDESDDDPNHGEGRSRDEMINRLVEERFDAFCDEGSGQMAMLFELVEEVNGDFDNWFKSLLIKKFGNLSESELKEAYDDVYQDEDEDEDEDSPAYEDDSELTKEEYDKIQREEFNQFDKRKQ